MKTFTADKNIKLKNFTDETYPQGGFYFAALLKRGDIKVNGVRVKTNALLKAGDTVAYYTTPKEESKQSHFVVYEDENIAVLDKFSAVNFEGLLSELNLKGKYYGVHRLDRNTSGLIVFAKNETAERELKAAFKEQRAEKIYIALCKDNFKKRSDTAVAYLKKDAAASLVKISFSPEPNFEKIITEYSVLSSHAGIAQVKITLHTGKTHQIRAHMAALGCPVLGDEKYGNEELNKKFNLKRQKLIAKTISFTLLKNLEYLSGKIFESRFNLEL